MVRGAGGEAAWEGCACQGVGAAPSGEVLWQFGTGPEPGSGGDPKDDGWGFFSTGWGNGHEGVGIEILYLLSFVFEIVDGSDPVCVYRAERRIVCLVSGDRIASSASESRRVCCGVWGGTRICGKCCHVWCSRWADEPHARRRRWWAWLA